MKIEINNNNCHFEADCGLLDSFHFAVIPNRSPYPKPFKQQTSGLPMLRIVIPNSSPYPKPFKQQTSFAVWLF